MIFYWSLTNILSLLWKLPFHSCVWHRNQSSRDAASLHNQLSQNRLSLASEEKGYFTVVCNLTGDSKMLLKYYLSSSNAPFLSPFLYYTPSAHMRSHNRKKYQLLWFNSLISFYCFFPSGFWLSQCRIWQRQRSYPCSLFPSLTLMITCICFKFH